MTKKAPAKRGTARVPVQERGLETRERLVAAARALFEQKGYHGTNSKEIAAKAGVAIGSFYQYFDDKKPLFLEIISRFYHEVAEEALSVGPGSLDPGGDPRALVSFMVGRLVAAHTIAPGLHREIMAMMYSDAAVRALIHEREEEVVARITALLDLVADRLRVTDREAAARVVHRSAEEVIHGIKMFGAPIGEERLLAQLEDMLTRYLFG